MILISNFDKNLFTPEQWTCLEAHQGKRAKEINKSDLAGPIRDTIVNVLLMVGQGKSITGAEITAITDKMIYELKTNFQGLTINEFRLAVDFGITGRLCDTSKMTQPLISAVNLIRFLTLYKNEKRAEMVAKLRKIEEDKEKEINEAERLRKISLFEAEIEKALQLPQEEKKALPMGLKAAYYRQLDKMGRVNLSVEEKKAIYESAKKMLSESPPDRNPFLDKLFEKRKKESEIIEIAESLAFEIL